MSEYQYCEYLAIDGPISDEGLRYARSCSSRATVSRFHWQNTYTFGDFRGSVSTLLKYYDAHFYLANWGVVRLGLAFPKGVLSEKLLQPYLRKCDHYEPTLGFEEHGERCIVWWEYNEEGAGWWKEGDGLIESLIGVREELMRGDFRSLFLGWLAAFHPEEVRSPRGRTLFIPPIPAGLNQLSPAQVALIEQFPVDLDALAVAAELSPAYTSARIPMAVALERLSDVEMRAFLGRVAEGGGKAVMAELNRLTNSEVDCAVGPPMKCIDFAAQVLEARSIRQTQEAIMAAAAKQRRKEAREQHLAAIMRNADASWAALVPLMEQKISSAYEQVAKQLQELRDAYAHAGDSAGFKTKISEFRNRYSNRPGMLRRIESL